jgi:lactoylglutathione lyase
MRLHFLFLHNHPAQMHIRQLNHVAIYVKDVDASHRFYSRIIGLESLPRPAFDFPGAWFRIGTDQELHLIGGRTDDEPVASQPRKGHFALAVPSIAEAEQELRAKNIPFTGPKPRPDGIFQIFVRDPDGYFVELCEVKL